MNDPKTIRIKGKCCSPWFVVCLYLCLWCILLAVMDYGDYQRMTMKKCDSKKEPLLQNPVQEAISVNHVQPPIPAVMSQTDVFQEQVGVDNANKDFNVDVNQQDDSVKVVPKTTLNSDNASIETEPVPSLLENVPETEQKKAKILLEKLHLDSYTGGIYTLDSEQYNNDDLNHLMGLLYKKKKDTAKMKVVGKDFMFIKSLHERDLKKYVKNKLLFGFVKGSEWWNLNV